MATVQTPKRRESTASVALAQGGSHAPNGVSSWPMGATGGCWSAAKDIPSWTPRCTLLLLIIATARCCCCCVDRLIQKHPHK